MVQYGLKNVQIVNAVGRLVYCTIIHKMHGEIVNEGSLHSHSNWKKSFVASLVAFFEK